MTNERKPVGTVLSSKALLANLNISQWTGRKFDKRATGTVESTHATDKHVGNYTKKLLPGAKELEEVQRIAGSIRNFYYDQTLPWYSDGSRILSSKNYLDFTNAFRAKKAEYDAAVEKFFVEYPVLQAKAQSQLGNLYNGAEYPSVAYLRTAFNCEISFMPIPDVSDFRVEILDSEKTAFLDRMKEIETTAMRDCWERLYGVVSKAAQKLSEPEAIFRDSLVENITELCGLLPKLNVMDDSNLESMRQSVESVVSQFRPDDLREDMTHRTDAVRALDEITAKMSAFMGSSS